MRVPIDTVYMASISSCSRQVFLLSCPDEEQKGKRERVPERCQEAHITNGVFALFTLLNSFPKLLYNFMFS